MEFFNEEEVYDNKISPLMKQLIDVCNEHKIPMLASFTYENCEEKGIGRCSTLLNGHDGRKDDAHQSANTLIRSGGNPPLISTIVINQTAE